MILFAITTFVILFAILASASLYFAQRDDITEQQEESLLLHGERGLEVIEPYYTKDGIQVRNTGSSEVVVSGIMVLCNNGTSFQIPYDKTIPIHGELLEYGNENPEDDNIIVQFKTLGGLC